MEKNSLLRFFQKKVENASEKKIIDKISIQNGDFSILNGEKFSVEIFFEKKVENASEKK